MGIRSNVSNFIYAATHANQLIADNQRMRQELAENSSIIEMQTNEIRSMSEANEALSAHSDFWKRNYSQNLSEGFSPEQAKSTYQSICLTVDPEGTLLFTEAQKMWGDFNYEYFDIQDMEQAGADVDGHQMMEDFKYYLDKAYPHFRDQEDALYTNVLVKLGVLDASAYRDISPEPLPTVTPDQIAAPEMAKKLYETTAVRLDPQGFRLFHTAEDILGKLDTSGWPYETAMGQFEKANGRYLMKYLLVDKANQLGEANAIQNRWAVVPGSHCERCTNFSINKTTPEYQAFEQALYRQTCENLGLVEPQAAQPGVEVSGHTIYDVTAQFYARDSLSRELGIRAHEREVGVDLSYQNRIVPATYTDEEIQKMIDILDRKQDIARVAEHYSHYFDNGGMRDNDIKAIAAQMREYINGGVDPDDAFTRAVNEHENEKLIDQAVHMIRYEVGQGHSASQVRAMLVDPNQCVYGDPLPAEAFDEAYKRFETENANAIAVEPPAPEPVPEPEFELE